MRISDWSSDVCSSDLQARPDQRHFSQHDIRRILRLECAITGAETDLYRHAPRRCVVGPQDRPGAVREFDLLDLEQSDRSEEHTSELQSLMRISYAVFCLSKN